MRKSIDELNVGEGFNLNQKHFIKRKLDPNKDEPGYFYAFCMETSDIHKMKSGIKVTPQQIKITYIVD